METEDLIIEDNIDIDEEVKPGKLAKIRKFITGEIILLFVFGFLFGVVVKTEAAKRITIGFNDYKAVESKQEFDFIQIQKDLEAQAAAQQNIDGNSQIQPQQ